MASFERFNRKARYDRKERRLLQRRIDRMPKAFADIEPMSEADQWASYSLYGTYSFNKMMEAQA